MGKEHAEGGGDNRNQKHVKRKSVSRAVFRQSDVAVIKNRPGVGETINAKGGSRRMDGAEKVWGEKARGITWINEARL